jgi:hypothetical protein
MIQVAFAVLLAASVSRGARAEGDKTTAEALFSEGRRLMAAGNYAAACEKFASSRKLDDGLGTTLNLAGCYEKLGRTASAWAEFRDAAATARQTGAREREQFARDRVAALEKKLSRLTLTAAKTEPDERISRDGAVVDRGVLGTAIPVDPGSHVLEAVAPGKKKWSVVIDVRPASQVAVSIPALEADSAGPAARSDLPVKRDDTASASGRGSTQRIVALGVGGLGVAGLVVGSIFGLQAKSNWADAKQHCRNYPLGCGEDGVALGENAERAALLSNISFAVGVVGLAGGAALWLSAPSATPSQSGRSAPLSVGFDGRQVLIRGSLE